MAQSTIYFKLTLGQFRPGALGVTVDADNAVYIADADNGRILKFDSKGNFVGATGKGQLNGPRGLALNRVAGSANLGDLYVADYFNHRIQRFDKTGKLIATIGGAGTGDGLFNNPSSVAIDGTGNLFVTDSGNHRVQKFDKAGTFLGTIGGFGTAQGKFSTPTGLALDASGNLFVVDTGNNRVQKFNSAGTLVKVMGGLGSGNGQFNVPYGIATDASGNFYVADQGNYRVQKFDNNGVFVAAFGGAGTTSGKFGNYGPFNLSVDASGNIYVADPSNYRIVKFSNAFAATGQVPAVYNAANLALNRPSACAIDGTGNFYVADTSNNTVQKFDYQGNFLAKFGQLAGPLGIAVDSKSNVYVADTNNHQIQKFDASGTFVGKFGTNGSNNGQFQYPAGVSLDASGNIYVADTNNNRIQKFDASGNFLLNIGTYGTGKGQLFSPAGVFVNSAGNIFVADTGNSRVQKFDSKGTWLATIGASGTGSGQFVSPSGVTVDSLGFVYVADTGNNRIQRFDSTGAFVSSFQKYAWGDQLFNQPIGVTVDATGNIVVCDTRNNVIPVFSGNNPVPTLVTLSPNTVAGGSADTLVTITGTGFIPTSAVKFGATVLSPTLKSVSQMTVTVPKALLATVGIQNITVTNGTPGGGTSNPLPFNIVTPNPVPTLSAISPGTVSAGSGDTKLTLTGTNFVKNSVVSLAGTALSTTYVSATSVTAMAPASALSAPTTLAVTVSNPVPGGGTSGTKNFVVGPYAVPSLTTISPKQVTAGSGGFTMTLTGVRFAPTSVAHFGTTLLTTTVVSSGQLKATVPSSLLTKAGKFYISVQTPRPGGGTSNYVTFTVNNPMPTLTAVAPDQIGVGAASTTLTLTGTNFINGAKVFWNDTLLSATFVSGTTLTAVVPSTALISAGDFDVTVANPSPGGGMTPAQNVSVVNPVPTLTSVSPTKVVEGTTNTTCTVTGTGFLPTSAVMFGDTPLVTTYVSSTQLKAVIPSAQFLNPGAFDVYVTTPAPGGGDTDPKTFTVSAGATTLALQATPVPTVTRSSTSLFVSVTLVNTGKYIARNVTITGGKLNTAAATAIVPADGLIVPVGGTATVTFTFPITAANKGTTATVAVTYKSDNASTGTLTTTTGLVP